MSLAVRDVDFHVLNMRTRMPFKYGIATLEALPHLFTGVTLEVNGRLSHGVASEGLAPKWFTKDPDTTFEQDVADMIAVITSAADHAKRAGQRSTVFELWQRIYHEQRGQWSGQKRFPPLLWGFGVSMVERAILDAFCRATDTTFARALRDNTPGIDLGALHEPLRGARPADFLPPVPPDTLIARHTVGLADPVTDADIPVEERLDDGLPQSLEQAVAAYGLTHFKIKLGGDPRKDFDRLQKIAHVIGRGGRRFAVTLDGNEFYRSVEPFEAFWKMLWTQPNLASFLPRILFVEQPFHRDVALSAETAGALLKWTDRPPIIIDESDAEIQSPALALRSGYVGSSHKNCKGVIHGLATACLIAHHRRENPDKQYSISGEDMCSVGPVAMCQDLLVAANLGVEHVERNGHHYFRGLGMYPADVQQLVLQHHGDLYRAFNGIPVVNVSRGRVSVKSLVEAPFALGFELDTTRFTPLSDWRFESLDPRRGRRG